MSVKREACDVHFSKAVRHRDRHRCVYCYAEGTDCAHVFGRARKSTRWSMDNALCLCRYHHRYFTANPVEFYDFLVKIWGEGHMNLLREKANSIYKTTKDIRKEISKHYREELKKAEADPNCVIVSWN